MKRWIFIVPLLIIVSRVAANGDPVAEFCALRLSKSPVQRTIPEIQIERENLHITLEYGQSRICVDYVLHNTSNKSFRNIHYGFPVDWEGDTAVHWVGDFYSESQYQKGWSDDYVRDFSFSLNGKTLPAKMSGDTVIKPAYTSADWHRDFGYPNWHNFEYDTLNHERFDSEDPYNWCDIMAESEWDSISDISFLLDEPILRRWYYTQFTLSARETATLHVEYTLSHSMTWSLYSLGEVFHRAFESWVNKYQGGEWINKAYNRFRYDFSPAAAWGDGTTRKLDITIEAPDISVLLPGSRDSVLFIGSYHRHHTNFRYAEAKPLAFDYQFPIPDSLDVCAIRDHRLAPTHYLLRQHEGDTCRYESLSDMNGCTGVYLHPNESDEYFLEVVLTDSIPITGLAILHGCYCDSLSWVSTPRAQKMQVDLWVRQYWEETPSWDTYYGSTEWTHKWIEANHYPALCKTDAPADFTWKSLVQSMEKINIGNRGFESGYGYCCERNVYPQRIRIYIPKQEHEPFVSEIILLR